jgi:ABC-type lipoprotein release transport system permease subunit
VARAAAGQLTPGSWNIVLGAELARQLGVHAGDKVTLVAPGGQVTPAGVVPRSSSSRWPAPSTPGTTNTTAAWR